ncbi:phospholipase [Halobacteriales archaeon QS_5_70_17]|nr:MAG: phospholipase [Halobacteriales archaeon QS_5_70_17]
MRRFALACLLACSLVAGTGTGTGTGVAAPALGADPSGGDDSATHAAADGRANATASLAAVFPDPVAGGDAGEFVVLDVPPGTDLGSYRLCDAGGCLALPNASGGRVAVTGNPGRVRNLTGADTRVSALPGDRRLELANGGERIELRRGGVVADAVRYGSTTEGSVYRRVERERTAAGHSDAWAWRPLGATDRPVVESGPASVAAFALPDSPAIVRETVAAADDRILLAGYTFTSERIADALIAARERGVAVRVLVEGRPVGGASARQAAVLDRLAAAGVEVRAVGGPHARYEFHHAKYAVVDDRALVLTENWKPAGVGGRSSRGWGARIDDPEVAAALAATFRADAGWRDARPWPAVRADRRFERALAANGSYPTRIDPETVRAERVRLLVAPDNADRELRDLIDGADERVDVVQVSLGSADGPFAAALIRAARRGVEVRVLLSGAWYVREDNRELADRLEARADREDLPLSVRLADPGDRFEKVHAKGAVVDDRVALGSLNWNRQAAEENREVVVVLEGGEPAAYYGEVFAEDWAASGGAFDGRGLPGIAVGAAGVAVLAALVVARRVEFE